MTHAFDISFVLATRFVNVVIFTATGKSTNTVVIYGKIKIHLQGKQKRENILYGNTGHQKWMLLKGTDTTAGVK